MSASQAVRRARLAPLDFWWNVVLLYMPALLILLSHLVWVVTEPLSFDEAFNLQVPLNLALGNGYQTWYGGPHPFDIRITTGPTVLLPIAPVLRILPPTAVAGRAVMVLFFVAFLATLGNFSRCLLRDHHRLFFATSLFFIAVLPSFFVLTAAVMGEIPSITLYLLALIIASRPDVGPQASVVAGLCFGFAVLTKLTIGMCLPVLLVTLGVRLVSRGFRGVLAGLTLCGLAMSTPMLLWHAYKAFALGVPQYVESVKQTIGFIQTHGSGADRVPFSNLQETLSAHLAMLSKVFEREPLTIGLGLLAVIVCASVVWHRHSRTSLGFATAASATLLTGWWLALSNWNLYRHAVPGYIFVAFVCAYLLVEGGLALGHAAWWERAIIIVGLVAVFLTIPFRNSTSILSATLLPGGRAAQQSLAALIRQIHASEPQASFWGYGWYQAPEISYLAAVPFRDVTQKQVPGGGPRYLVVGPHFGGTVVDDYTNRWCATDLFREGFYRLCRLKD